MIAGFNKFSVFKRLFIVYLLTFVVIYIVIIWMFLSNINRTSEEQISQNTSRIEAYLGNLEQQLDIIHNQQINLMNTDDIRKLAYSVYNNNYERTQLILNLLREIESSKSVDLLIEDIILTFPEQHIILSSREGYQDCVSGCFDEPDPGMRLNTLISVEDRLAMNFSYPLTSSSSTDYIPDFNIQIILSKAELTESLKLLRNERGSGAGIWFQTREEIILENNPEGIVESHADELFEIISSSPEETVTEAGDYQFIVLRSSKYPMSIISFTDKKIITGMLTRYISVLTALMLIIGLMFIFSLIFTKKAVIKPLHEIMSAFEKIQNDDFSVRIYHEPHDEFNYIYHGFNKTATYIQELINNIYEQENLIQNAELAQLQSQINPHFLYNSFFIINRMAMNEDYEQITKFVTSLAKYYRFINKETKNYISLAREVEHMQNYIAVQQMRFEDKIKVVIQPLPAELTEVNVPKLILQPVIENAYNYGLVNVLENGIINVGYRRSENLLSIIIEDNGEEADTALVAKMIDNLKDDSGFSENHALTNINRRLVLVYGRDCGVFISLSDMGGIKIELKINPAVEIR